MVRLKASGHGSDFSESIISVPINTGRFHAPADEAILLIGLVKAPGFVNEDPVVNIYLQVTRGRAKGGRGAEPPPAFRRVSTATPGERRQTSATWGRTAVISRRSTCRRRRGGLGRRGEVERHGAAWRSVKAPTLSDLTVTFIRLRRKRKNGDAAEFGVYENTFKEQWLGVGSFRPSARQ